MSRHAVVVLSGGQDSVTCLFWALHCGEFDRVSAITFDYGQRHALEIEAAELAVFCANATSVANGMPAVAHEVLPIPGVLRSTSPLVDRHVELETYEDFAQMSGIIGDRVELTFVPMRNPLFLTIATNYAIAVGSRDIVTGVCQEDNANYPDCTEDFIAKFALMANQALGLAQKPDCLRVHTPLIHFSKKETVELAQQLPGAMNALAYSHTCYAGVFPPCGECHSCLLRAEGFAQAGVEDPLVRRATGAINA